MQTFSNLTIKAPITMSEDNIFIIFFIFHRK